MADLRDDDDQLPSPEGKGARARQRLRIVVTLTLVAAIVALAGLEGSGLFRVQRDLPASTPSARIAVVDANGALATMDERGNSVVSYVAPGVAFQFPAWSPDGSRIAAIGHDPEGIGIYVFAARPTEADQLRPTIIYHSPDRPPFYLYWTPDGGRLTFLTTEPDGIGLRIAPADGRAPDATIRHGSPLYWDWVDPARLLVHLGGSGPEAFVGEIGLDGVSVETTVIASGRFRSPGVTHDRRYRAYVAPTSDAAGEIVVESRDGSSSHAVPVFGSAAIDFDPADDKLAFIAPEKPTGQAAAPAVGPLRLVDAGSGSVRTLLDGSVVAFFWAPNGLTVAALRLDAPGPGNVATAQNGILPALARITRSSAADPAQANGVALRLVFVDVASGKIRSKPFVRLSNLFVSQLLPFFDQYALSHRLWSSDSASVVLPLVGEDGLTRLFVVPADGTEAHRVADGAMGFWSP